MNVWKLSWRIARQDERTFWWGNVLFLLFFLFPVANGWVLGRAFSALRDGRTSDVALLACVLVVNETLRMASIHGAAILWTQAFVHMQSLMRSNMLAAQLASGGPESGQPVGSSGEAIPYFRDDVEDVTQFINDVVDMSAGLIFTVLAAFILATIDASAAFVLAIPLVVIAVATRTLDKRITAYRSADRAIGGKISGLLGDLMSAATTIKVNDAAESSLARVQLLVDERRITATRDRVLDEGVQALGEGAADVGLGLVLIASATAIASGRFGVGQLAVFVAYLGWLSFLPPMIGRVLARRKQAGVAFGRMRRLVAGQDVDRVAGARELPIGPRQTLIAAPTVRPSRVVLQSLHISALSATYGQNEVLHNVNFSVQRGQFVVITGPIGSGKTTLLRSILGLAHNASVTGEVRWNHEPINDRAAFFVPPMSGYLPQVPQLISDSVRDNVALGMATDCAISTALRLAEVETDVEEMHDGVQTLIGPRGLRLSGGQRQRVATARAIVHQPELVVLDDLSSALDVETELRLWTNLAEAGMTVLAVSHRAVAFERADLVLRLQAGQLA